MQGVFEVTTTAGDSYRFGPGDCLFADDVGTRGHTFEDVGDEPLVGILVAIDPDWKAPGD
jgi:hypothetical protein